MAGQVISIEKRSNRQGGLMSCAHGSGMATFDSTPDSLYKSCQYLKLSKSLKCHLKAGYSLLLLNEAKIVEWLAAGPPTVLQKCSSRMSAAGAYFFDCDHTQAQASTEEGEWRHPPAQNIHQKMATNAGELRALLSGLTLLDSH